MALRELNAACNNCSGRFRAKPTRSFLGFQKLGCPQCGRKLLYPLTSGYRAIYWAFVLLFGLGFTAYLFGNEVLWPGGTGIVALIAGIIGLVKDGMIQKSIANLESRDSGG